jgi:hypothetical protein
MKRFELFSIQSVIEEMLKTSKIVKLNFVLIANKKNLESEIESIKKSMNVSEEYTAYDETRVNLCKVHCEKDETGEPKMKNNSFVGLDNNPDFVVAVKNLQGKNKKAIDEHNTKLTEYNDFLNEDIEFEFKKIDPDIIPNDMITGEMQSILIPLFDME